MGNCRCIGGTGTALFLNTLQQSVAMHNGQLALDHISRSLRPAYCCKYIVNPGRTHSLTHSLG